MSLEKKSDGFIMQAGILAMAGIICRIIGILYRSPLAAIIGDEGNGYYGSAYNIYTIILLISSYSIPAAISKVIAGKLALKEYKNAQRIFYCAFIYVIVVGGCASLFAFFGAGFLVEQNAVMVLRVFSPTIFVSGLLGVLRGYFQAHKTMVQTSVSQILEQILNAIISIMAAYLLKQLVIDRDPSTQAVYGAMGSALGTGAGVLIALAFMTFMYGMHKKEIKERIQKDEHKEVLQYSEIFKIIFSLVTPFILSTFIYNFSTSLDETIYRKILKLMKDVDVSQIAIWYGVYSGKAVVISNIPIAIASAMSAAMIPSVSGKYATGDVKGTRSKVHTAILTTMLIAIPSMVGIFVLAEPVVSFLFPGQSNIPLAGALLRALSVTIVFYSLSTLTNAVLQGIGKVTTPVYHAAIALVVQTLVLIPCLIFTDWNLYCIAIATIVYSFLMCVLNQRAVRKYLDYKQDMKKIFALPFLASVIMGIVAYFAYKLFFSALKSNVVSLLISVAIAAFVYGVLILKLRVLNKDDILAMPKGKKLAGILAKLHLV
ncbi:MAG: polysaccharide biosynthesis protein [Lachnospiraceae bacterium]|nr:polysaccharide biosynthesis protein [Lachnospiraceae bacterium]